MQLTDLFPMAFSACFLTQVKPFAQGAAPHRLGHPLSIINQDSIPESPTGILSVERGRDHCPDSLSAVCPQ